MARFYGSVQGSRGSTHRLGGASSGIEATVASWQGAIHVQAYTKGDHDYVAIRFCRWEGRGSEGLIYDGPIDGVMPACKTKRRKQSK